MSRIFFLEIKKEKREIFTFCLQKFTIEMYIVAIAWGENILKDYSSIRICFWLKMEIMNFD